MKLKFVRYYKYTFTFQDEVGNEWVTIAGSDDIYRFEVNAEDNIAVEKEIDGNKTLLLDGIILEKI